MFGAIIVWIIALFLLLALLYLIFYQLTSFADLEYDYITPYDLASRIEAVNLPEFALQGILCLIFLFSGHWIMFLICTPILCYNWKMYRKRQHLVDVTEIFNQLHKEKTRRLVKFIYNFPLLFLALYWLIWSISGGDTVHAFIILISITETVILFCIPFCILCYMWGKL